MSRWTFIPTLFGLFGLYHRPYPAEALVLPLFWQEPLVKMVILRGGWLPRVVLGSGSHVPGVRIFSCFGRGRFPGSAGGGRFDSFHVVNGIFF